MKKKRDQARATALKVLNTLDNSSTPLDTIIETIFQERHPSKQDRAFVFSLVYGVLRWRSRLDWIIKYFSRIPIDQIDLEVRNVLRLGLFQIIYLTRVPVSAAVNTSVELTKSVAGAWVVKFVNALLRKACHEHGNVKYPDINKNPALSIAMEYAFPEWLIKRWLPRLGTHETISMCRAINTIPPITVRTNCIKTERDELVQLLRSEAADVKATPYSPDGVSFYNPKLPIPNLTAYQKGWFQVQDEAAQLISLFLNPRPHETVLDACAGLGGKTGHMAQLMQNKGRIIAMDNQKDKLSRLRSEMLHLGVSIVTTNVHDLNTPFERTPSRKFDRILLDAPCTGLGVLRRNPDAKWVLSKKNFPYYTNRQVQFLKAIAPLLKVGGVLLYSVCSTEPEENEQVLEIFLKEHPEFVIHTERQDLDEHILPFIETAGLFRTYPHSANMDGFFAALLKKIK
jgi:16S rRNA (cytosine967-C5)-methyltransferase